MFETKAVFMIKNTEIEAADCVVDKTIQLSSVEFDIFSRNLTRDWDFIRDNQLDVSIDADGRRHCLLVTGENRNDGILVSSEGADYARYSAFLPNAAAVLDAARYPALAELSASMALAADDVIGQRLAEWPEGVRVEDPSRYAVSFAYLNSKYGLAFDGGAGLEHAFCQMLCDRPEIKRASYNMDEFLIDAEPLAAALESGQQNMEAGMDDAEYADKEFAAWKNLSDGIPGHWREDKRYRQKKDGALYYIGGERGQYMRVTGNGKLTVGKYDLARPGIEDAVLIARITQQYGSYEQAFLAASQLASRRFISDIFKEKPSVMKQIREARNNPAPPTAKKEQDKGAPGPEI